MRGAVDREPTHGEGLLAVQRVVSRAARAWPHLTEAERPAAFAAAIDAVEAVEWLPMAEQHHLLAAKLALSAGTADGLTDEQRRGALFEAERRIGRAASTQPPDSSDRGPIPLR